MAPSSENEDVKTAWWTFSVFADSHAFGYFPFMTPEKAKSSAEDRSKILTSIVRNYEGGLVALTVGDSVSFGGKQNQFIKQKGGKRCCWIQKAIIIKFLPKQPFTWHPKMHTVQLERYFIAADMILYYQQLAIMKLEAMKGSSLYYTLLTVLTCLCN
mmetsp:Transcript_9188/g.25823  ORF Transcript_9188/g.25823 Transcript_9188/m.25823 type:complete len:157 (-) Transcript_9188:3750-4220(-)